MFTFRPEGTKNLFAELKPLITEAKFGLELAQVKTREPVSTFHPDKSYRTTKSANKLFPLNAAILYRDTSKIDALLEQSDLEINEKNSNSTPFLLACFVGNVALLKKLISKGAETKQEDASFASPLNLAICNPHFAEVLPYLLDELHIPFPENQSECEKLTRKLYALHRGETLKIEGIKILLEHAIKKNLTESALYFARLLYAAGVDCLGTVLPPFDEQSAAPFMEFMIRWQNISLLDQLTDKHPRLGHWRGVDQETLAMQAAGVSSVSILELLKRKGFLDISAEDDGGDPALRWAIMTESIPATEWLLREDKAQTYKKWCRPKSKATYFHLIAFEGALKTAQLLLDSGIPFNEPDCDGYTPFSYAASNGCPTIIKFFIDLDTDKNMINWQVDSINLMFQASRRGSWEALPLLKAAGVKLLTTKNGETSFSVAVELDHLPIVQWHFENYDPETLALWRSKEHSSTLLGHAARHDARTSYEYIARSGFVSQTTPNRYGFTPLAQAVGKNHVKLVRWIVETDHQKESAPLISWVDPENLQNLLFHAIYCNAFEAFQYLAQFIKLTQTNKFGYTPFAFAVGANKLKFVEYMFYTDPKVIKWTAPGDLSIRSSDGRNALFQSIEWGCLETFIFLTGLMSLTQVNRSGLTPLEYAVSRDKPQIVQYLIENVSDLVYPPRSPFFFRSNNIPLKLVNLATEKKATGVLPVLLNLLSVNLDEKGYPSVPSTSEGAELSSPEKEEQEEDKKQDDSIQEYHTDKLPSYKFARRIAFISMGDWKDNPIFIKNCLEFNSRTVKNGKKVRPHIKFAMLKCKEDKENLFAFKKEFQPVLDLLRDFHDDNDVVIINSHCGKDGICTSETNGEEKNYFEMSPGELMRFLVDACPNLDHLKIKNMGCHGFFIKKDKGKEERKENPMVKEKNPVFWEKALAALQPYAGKIKWRAGTYIGSDNVAFADPGELDNPALMHEDNVKGERFKVTTDLTSLFHSLKEKADFTVSHQDSVSSSSFSSSSLPSLSGAAQQGLTFIGAIGDAADASDDLLTPPLSAAYAHSPAALTMPSIS